VWSSSSLTTVSNSTFTGARSFTSGGAIYLANASNATIIDTVFQGTVTNDVRSCPEFLPCPRGDGLVRPRTVAGDEGLTGESWHMGGNSLREGKEGGGVGKGGEEGGEARRAKRTRCPPPRGSAECATCTGHHSATPPDRWAERSTWQRRRALSPSLALNLLNARLATMAARLEQRARFRSLGGGSSAIRQKKAVVARSAFHGGHGDLQRSLRSTSNKLVSLGMCAHFVAARCNSCFPWAPPMSHAPPVLSWVPRLPAGAVPLQ
jgi:hypothetical protein